MKSRDVFAGVRIYISVAFARIGDAIARTRPTEANRSILGRTHLKTPSRGPLSAVLAAGTAPATIFCAAADSWRTTGRVSPELWGQIGPMGSGGRRGSRRPPRTVCADDTDGKVGDSLEATRERSPTVPSPVIPANPVWDLSVAESSGPSGGKSDGGVVGEVTRLVGTPIHAHSLVVG